MNEIFIGSSLRKSFPISRIELKHALQRVNLPGITWEKDRPAGSKITEGEKYMIGRSKVSVFLFGSEASPGTLEEYHIAEGMEQLIILVDATPLEGKTTSDMNPELKEIWNRYRDKDLITITWTNSDEVANQIANGIERAFPGSITKTSSANCMEILQNKTTTIKTSKYEGFGRFICVACPSDYRGHIFDLRETNELSRLLNEMGSDCLPTSGRNLKFGPNKYTK